LAALRAAQASSMHSRRAGRRAASSVLPELMFGDFLLLIARMASSSRVRAFADHRSNA
jgi:hypothetical protein